MIIIFGISQIVILFLIFLYFKSETDVIAKKLNIYEEFVKSMSFKENDIVDDIQDQLKQNIYDLKHIKSTLNDIKTQLSKKD